MAVMTYSFSRLDLYVKCPFKFYLRYIEKREEPDSEPLALGKAVHKAIEMKMLGSSLQAALFAGLEEIKFFNINLEEYKSLVNAAPVIIGEGLTSDVEVEKHFELSLSDSEDGPKLQGYIDVTRRIFDMVSFTDWKSNRIKYDPQETMQLPLYAWALAKIYNVKTVIGTLFFLRYKKKPAETITFTKAEMERARHWALSKAEEIENKLFILELMPNKVNELFPATPHANCKHCPFALECYRKSKGVA